MSTVSMQRAGNVFSSPDLVFIADGTMTYSPETTNYLKSKKIVAVDGGLNHCYNMGKDIIPQMIFGDFDSASPQVLAMKAYQFVERITLDRAKDVTDLEGALQHYKIENLAQVIIFGALGKRIDHALYNLYLAMRFPLKIVLETQDEVLFMLGGAGQSVSLTTSSDASLVLLPFYNKVEGLTVESGQEVQDVSLSFESKEPFSMPLAKGVNLRVSVNAGYVLCIVNKKSGVAEDSMCTLLPHIYQICLTGGILHHPSAQIQGLKGGQSIIIAGRVGQTVSLIPIMGPVKGIKTEGFKWELGKGIDRLDYNFVGLSNVLEKEQARISLQEGYLICVLTHHIDTQMLRLKDTTRTGILTKKNLRSNQYLSWMIGGIIALCITTLAWLSSSKKEGR